MSSTIIDDGGPVITFPKLQIIFWGKYWTGTPDPTLDQISKAFTDIITGPYMSGLSQYRGIGYGQLSTKTVFDGYEPPNPVPQSGPDAQNLLMALTQPNQGGLPPTAATLAPTLNDPQSLYCIILPPNVDIATADAFHGSFSYKGMNIHFMMLTYKEYIDGFTIIFSHELAEGCTDPEGSAIHISDMIDEICDQTDHMSYIQNRQVTAYWSANDQKYVTFGDYWITTFYACAGYAIPNGSWLVGDFNGDGKDDIVHIVKGVDYINVWLSNGDGTFTIKQFDPPAGHDHVLGNWLVGDFNGDGKDDLVYVNGLLGIFDVWISNGDGTFTLRERPRVTPWHDVAFDGSWLVGDFNGDGKDDLLLIPTNPLEPQVNVFFSNGDGTFNRKISNIEGSFAGTWHVGDFDGDGKDDWILIPSNSSIFITYLSNGDGTFKAKSNWTLPTSDFSNWLVGDFDGDGKDDIFFAGPDAFYYWAGISNGDGTFRFPFQYPGLIYYPFEDDVPAPVFYPPATWLVGDFNGDGKDDVAIPIRNTNMIYTLLSNGDGSFGGWLYNAWDGYKIPNGLWLVGDFDGDKTSDIVHAVQGTNYVNLWRSLFSLVVKAIYIADDGTFIEAYEGPGP